MAKTKRLSEILREECDGPDAVAAFESWGTLREQYPVVAEALEHEAEHRHMKSADALDMARNAVIAMVGEQRQAPTPRSRAKGGKPDQQQQRQDRGDDSDGGGTPPAPKSE